MDRLREAKGPSFEQLPVRCRTGLVRERQGLPGRVDRSPDVLARPLAADQPAFVEEFDIAAPVDFAHEVEAACGQRDPGGGEVWEHAPQGGCQPGQAAPARIWAGVLPANPGGRYC